MASLQVLTAPENRISISFFLGQVGAAIAIIVAKRYEYRVTVKMLKMGKTTQEIEQTVAALQGRG